MELHLQHACERLEQCLSEIERIEQSDFPYSDSYEALDLIRTLFTRQLSELQSFGPLSDKATVRQHCTLALQLLFVYLPILGLILRSTNVRNTFETFRPLQALVRSVLDGTTAKTRLVLSSEWNYSPQMFDEFHHHLSDFVFIGFPACESGNPMLVPLAGHELAHLLWRKQDLEATFKPTVTSDILRAIRGSWAQYKATFGLSQNETDLAIDMYLVRTWEPIVTMALSQAEETFCDFVGVRIFGQAYLQAFAYLISPSIGGERPVAYPNLRVRVENLAKVASQYGVSVPAEYAASFDDESPPSLDSKEALRLEIADQVLVNLIPALAKKADELLAPRIEMPSEEEVTRIYGRFLLVVPAENCKSLADILNAGWRAISNPDFWKNDSQVRTKKDSIIKELVVKTIELFYIEQKLP